MAVNAGVDMSMVPNDLSFYHDLIALVKEGKVPEERINDAVRRILRVKYRLGLFDDPFPEPEAAANFGKLVYNSIALAAARESMTLLKNDTLGGKPVLPLKKNTRVLLAGPAVNSLASLHGSWSFCWQGNVDSLYPDKTRCIREAFEEYAGRKNVITVAPSHFDKITSRHLAAVKKYARHADVIILCLGEDAYAEGFGSIDDLTLPADQLALARTAAATGKPVNLKKGQFLSPWDMAYVVEKAASTGNRRLLVTERGTCFGYHNLVVDFRSLVVMREFGYPVIFDATHSVQLPGGGASSGGERRFAPALARAAVAVGAQGVFLEVHEDPDRALCDGPNSLPLRELPGLLGQLKAIREALR